MSQEKYKKTVSLLLEILPFALKDERVALKGGTAINLFHRDFPRLSVDIDLCYLPLEDRATTFRNLHSILEQIKYDLETKLGLKVNANNSFDGKKEIKIVASQKDIEVKIEPNFTLRGSLFLAENLDLSQKASKEFEKSVQARCLNMADTYGGKICAALDRQHPRDLFDIKFLLENEGVTTDVKDSFVFYLISHSRPINEILDPNFRDISKEYQNEFLDMTKVQVTLDELVSTREKLVIDIKNSLTENDKNFLISFVSNKPDWSLIRDSKIKDYPSVQWKLMNQKVMSSQKTDKYINLINRIFA